MPHPHSLRLAHFAVTAAIAFAATSAHATGSVVTAQATLHPNGKPTEYQYLSVSKAPNVANDVSVRDATDYDSFYNGAGASYEPGKLKVDSVGYLGRSQGHEGAASLTQRATVSVTDSLTLSAEGQEGRLVVLHKELHLEPFTRFIPNVHGKDPSYRMSAYVHNEVYGDGIEAGPLGGPVFGMDSIELEPGHTSHGKLYAPYTVNFDFAFILGETTDFSLTLSQYVELELKVFNDSFFGDIDELASASLSWASGGSLVDAATGEGICGLSGASASGYDYLRGISISACPVTPPGGGVAVPEPSAWALSILGFGLAGARLRRRGWPHGAARAAA